MQMFSRVLVVLFLQILPWSFADHYKGGTITWKPVNPTSLTATVQIIITARHSWTLSRYPCNDTTISYHGSYNDTQNVTSSSLACISSSAACTSSLYQSINLPMLCTDAYAPFDVSTGSYTTRQNLTLNSVIDIAWRGASWSVETLTNAWSLVTRIDLTPIAGRINSPPVTGSLPLIRLTVNQLSVIQVLANDWDPDHIVRCRWSYQLPSDECGSVCFNLPNSSLSAQDCGVTWKAFLRPEDVANGLTASTYVVAITAEDFINATSTQPLSSVPHQLLVQVYTPPTGVCATRPRIISAPRRHQSCFAVSLGGTVRFNLIGQVGCLNDTIVDFVTSSPLYMQRSNMTQLSNYTWYMSFNWTTTSDQIGIQTFCAAAIDNNGFSSDQYCIAMVVAGNNPSILIPTFVQSTASPVGTVMSTQTRFSIQANTQVKRTTRNQTFIYIRQVTNNAVVAQIDCKYSPDIYFLNTTIVFFIRSPPWVIGMNYYVQVTEGVVTADRFCGTESGGFGYPYWQFTIWNPALSSTTTLSTTTFNVTVGTVTTRSVATTTGNTLSTTTGISAVPTFPTTTITTSTATSATTTSTSSDTTSTTTTTTTTESIPNAVVIYPKDYETGCLQPVTIATALVAIAMIPVHAAGMIILFVKTITHLQKGSLKVRRACRVRLQTPLATLGENETLV